MLAFLPAAVVLAIGALTAWRLDALGRSQGWVFHTRVVLATNDRLVGRLADLETGYRGYAITGDEGFLEPYTGAAEAARRDLARLTRLTADNPDQRRRVAALALAVDRQIAFGQWVLSELRAGGTDTYRVRAAVVRGKSLMDAVRHEAEGVNVAEHGVLAARSAGVERQARLVFLLIFVGATCAGLAAALTNLLFARTAERETRAAAELELQNRQLEEQAIELELQHEHLQEQASALESQAEELRTTAEELLERTQALQGSEEQLRGAVEGAGVATWGWDPASDRLIYQRGVDRLFGLSGPELTGREVLDAVHPADRPAVEAAIARSLSTGQDYDTEFRLANAGPGVRWLAGRGRVVRGPGTNGAPVRLVGINFDITARKGAEEQLRQVQQLQAVGTLAGGVAHEINNQMTAVLGFGGFALQALGPGHPQAADLGEVLQAAGRAARISEQLLTFSRRQLSQPRVLGLHQAVVALIPVLERLLGADKSLVIDAPASEHRVVADPTQIDQVLINLVANARDAMVSGGQVAIRIGTVLLDAAYAGSHGGVSLAPGPFICLSVSDNGRGMSQDTVAKIFEPFFTTKPVGQGSGLGLSMVYGIVKQHGGFVWAYSEPGWGTTLKVYLPQAPAGAWPVGGVPAGESQGGAAAATPVPVGPSDGGRVLVVEDEAVVRALAVRALAAAGYEVLQAADGVEALELLRQSPGAVDLILTDAVMPAMNGRELGEALGRLQIRLPVLYMSGYAGDDVFQRGLVPPDAPFLQKPFSTEALIERVRTVLRAARDGAGGAVA